MFARVLGFIYGVVCYLIFFGTFLYAIGFVGGGNLYGQGRPLVVPRSIDISPLGGSFTERLIIDAALLAVFAIQHSVMARPWFKKAWTKVVPPLLERSTYVLIASLLLLLLFWQWRPMGLARVAWDVENATVRIILQLLFWFGWLMVLVSTFLIDHFDLFGLKQAYCHLKGQECPPPHFKKVLFYKAVRHPIMLGFMIAFWSTPRMTMGHLFFAVMTTAYMIVAIQIEERDLIRAHGDKYEQYRKHVSMLLPVKFGGGKDEEEAEKEATQ
jgi:protein-S-isoprenylcysteine O-methyltransferase Ste14